MSRLADRLRSWLPHWDASLLEAELRDPTFITVFKVVWFSIRSFFVERPGQIIGSAFILIMVWGTHGRLELLRYVSSKWRGPGIDLGSRPQIIPGIPWDHELISFWVGALLLVGIPILMIKFVYRQPLSAFGLGFPPRARWRLAVQTFVLVTAITLPFFAIGSQVDEMRQLYPLYRPFDNWGSFILYELAYFPFFLAIEFIFRGYLLFGLAGVRDQEVHEDKAGVPGPLTFGRYALLIQMLSYTAWHLGKPTLEVWGTLVWGLAAGATAYMMRSIWPIVFSHWLLNVFIDGLIWRSL